MRGLNNHLKRKKLFREVRKERYDLFALQEIYCEDNLEQKDRWEVEWGGKIYYDCGASNARGVCILVSTRFDGKIEKVTTNHDGWVVGVELCIDGENFLVVNIYANQDNQDLCEPR